DGNDRCPLLQCGERTLPRHDDIDLEADELGRDLGKTFAPSLRPAILDRNGAPLNPAEFVQSLHKGGGPGTPSRRRGYAQEPNGWQLARWLRRRRERPRGRRAAEKRDEVAAPHSSTSSARARSVGGSVTPRTLAVIILMISSTFTACWTGRSAGLSPLRMRPT